MEYRTLGKTGLNISVVWFGGIPIQRVSAGEADAIVIRALDLGINFFDTARAYTDSEEKLGATLKKEEVRQSSPPSPWPGPEKRWPEKST